MAGVVRLAWVRLEDDELAHVSQFAHLRPGARPRSRCPVCEDEVVLRLGREKTHHAAHRPDVACAATGSETAKHLNTKLHIARQLRSGSVLTVQEHCSGAGKKGCSEAMEPRRWLNDWDDVKVEISVGSLRPDITIFRLGHPVAAVEVVATHAVSFEKAHALNALGLPWIEVAASEDIYFGPKPWLVSEALPCKRVGETRWVCDQCEDRRAKAVGRERAAHEKEEAEASRRAARNYEQKNGWHTTHHKVLDFYYPTGGKFRTVLIIEEQRGDGKVLSIAMSAVDGDLIVQIHAPTDGAGREVALALRKMITLKERQGSTVDSPMRWANGEGLTRSSLIYSDAIYPRRYLWSHKNNKWFLAKEYRQVRWDDDS